MVQRRQVRGRVRDDQGVRGHHHPRDQEVRARPRCRGCARPLQCHATAVAVAPRRLEELMRQLGDTAKGIGDTALEEKFRDAGAKMRRDIIFAASLYL